MHMLTVSAKNVCYKNLEGKGARIILVAKLLSIGAAKVKIFAAAQMLMAL